MKIDSLFQAKKSMEAFLNYNNCDKHCELPNHNCCCSKPCMSKNKTDKAYSIGDVKEGIKYILNYFERIGREMIR